MSDTQEVLDQLFRKSYAKLLSLLISKYGTSYIELIENAIMEAYYKALKTWPYKGKPDNPQGWLYRVARNSLIDALRKRVRRGETNIDDQALRLLSEEELLSEELIEDPELKLLFLICHPELSKEDQLAFMLKTISGFGNREISRALMIKEVTIKKRLQRARATIKKKALVFDWPEKSALPERLEMVHRALYLLFNEGFYSTHSEHWVRKDLCLEAMRLCKYLVDHEVGSHDTQALMSLMCYHISRFESRLDDHGNIVLLDQQDRSKWHPYFIKLGHFYLEKSAKDNKTKTKYQLEAYISAQHCLADKIETTNWPLLKALYEALYRVDHQDLVLLNLIIVHLHLEEIKQAQQLFNSIDSEKFVGNKTIYYMVGVELYSKLKNQMQIELLLERAIKSSDSKREVTYLKNKLNDAKNIKS